MSHRVIMPALGMAQETGRVVAWLRAPGERVAEGDPLFEVETDKAVMEVAAPASGFLSAVSAGAGAEVPVGEGIAEIVATEAEVSGAPAPAPGHEATPGPAPTPAAAPAAAPPTAAPGPAAAPAPLVSGRILASPLARRLAAEGGIDLAALRAQGVAEPILAADLRDRPRATAARAVLTARVDAAALDALLARADADLDRPAFHAAFAARAWAATIGGAEPTVAITGPDGRESRRGEGAPALRLVDLTASRLSGYAAPDGPPTLSLGREGGDLLLTLAFAEPALPLAGAMRWLDEVAARLANPIRQLL